MNETLMGLRRPRVVIGVAFVLLVAVVGFFAVALIRANGDERENALGRLKERAGITAALTTSLFGTTSELTAQRLREHLGADAIDGADVEAYLRRGDSQGYGFVLDERGELVALTADTPPTAPARATSSPQIRRLLTTGRYVLLDYQKFDGAPDSLLYALAYQSPAGRRIFVQGFPATLLSTFFGGYLASLPGTEHTTPYVLDAKGLVVGTSSREATVGQPVPERGLVAALRGGAPDGTFEHDGERVFAEAPVQSSTWRVVLTTPEDRLYPGTGSTVGWLILLALLLAGAAALGLLARALRATEDVSVANRRLERSNAELATANLELQRSNSELEQFASVASHDLQEPLRKVQTFGEQLARRFGDDIPDEGLEYLKRMRAAAGRMSVLIDDLLRFSRVTTRALPPEPVDLDRVAVEVTSDLDASLQEAHGSVDIAGLPTVEADPLQMRQLLQNLIANAIKFHRPGIPPEVLVRGAVTGEPGMAAFTVSDNGIGIEEQYAERIFRVFERLHPRDVYPGTGIGLALCRKIVERHGGTIAVESVPNGGATFIVTLPFAQARDEDPPPAERRLDADREPAHV